MVILLTVVFETSILVGCIHIAYGQSELPESKYVTSDSQCYGAGAFVNGTCPSSTSIALNNIRTGVQPLSQNCQANATAGDGSGCCETSSSACEFDFPITNNKLYHARCNGRQSCTPVGAQPVSIVHGSCNASLYDAHTQYMFFQHFCIEEVRITDTSGQNSAEDAALYLQNNGYPTSGIPAMTESACSVETDNCNAAIGVYVIERDLADCINSTHFKLSQSLSIIDADDTVLVNWTCQDNTFDIRQPLQSTENYLTVILTSTMTTNGGRFWIGFKATQVANLSVTCPAQDRQFCLPSTSTSTTPSTTTTPTTTTPTTTTTAASKTKTTTLFAAPSTPSSTDITKIIVVSGSIGGVFLVTLIIGLIIYWKQKRRKMDTGQQLTYLTNDTGEQIDPRPGSKSSTQDKISNSGDNVPREQTVNVIDFDEVVKQEIHPDVDPSFETIIPVPSG